MVPGAVPGSVMAGHAVPQWCDSASHQTIKSECRCFCGPSPMRRKAAAAVSPEGANSCFQMPLGSMNSVLFHGVVNQLS